MERRLWRILCAVRKDMFDELVESIKQMTEDLFAPTNVAALRAHFRLSQRKFAALLGISIDTLQNWEQGRRRPDGPAKVLLRVAAVHPEALLSVSKPAPRRRKPRRPAA